VTKRHIVASSGGFVQTDRWGVMVKPGQIFKRALGLTGKTRPTSAVFVLTASGDNPNYLSHQLSGSF
jgi:hypothetical protein